MTQRVAPTSTAITIITAGVLTLTGAFVIASVYHHGLIPVALLLVIATFFCYLTTPIEYELDGDRLTVFTHLGSRIYAPVVNCEPAQISMLRGIRVFGNGGVFGGTGFYWNRRYGLYRAYITSARQEDWLMIYTPDRRVLISPEDAESFRRTCESLTVSPAR